MEEKQRVGQEQIHGLLFGEQLSWQSIIYDLINSEQLDPWDIDISLLARKFLEKVKLLEEANFFVSSKVLMAAALLLRMKSELLIERDIQGLDDLLFGKKEEKKYFQERIELDEEIPELIVRTPLPRFKKVTLEELMKALGNALKTETRRIKRVVVAKQQEYETSLSLPKKGINLQDSIKNVHDKVNEIFSNRSDKLGFTELAGLDREERIATFIPLLHLDNQKKLWLEQEKHFHEIWILLKSMYEEKNKEELDKIKKEIEEELEKIEELEELEEGEDALAEDLKSTPDRFKEHVVRESEED